MGDAIEADNASATETDIAIEADDTIAVHKITPSRERVKSERRLRITEAENGGKKSIHRVIQAVI